MKNRWICLLLTTLFVLLPLTASANYETLSEGATGDAVLRLQKRLITLGYLEGDADADGIYGLSTVEAVNRLRASLGLRKATPSRPCRRRWFPVLHRRDRRHLRKRRKLRRAPGAASPVRSGYLADVPDGICGEAP
jgi:peptidoglycan hydrolase-like protein with peptidoglycan-binding domain